MTAIRLIAAALTALLATLSLVGFAVTQSLGQSQPFVAAMEEAIAQPAVQAEVADSIRQQIETAGERLAVDAGPLGELARSGTEAITGGIDSVVAGQRFAVAWGQWSRLLYGGLADYAAGVPNSEVSVSGNEVTVAIGPLVAPVVGDAVAGGLTSTLDVVGADTSVTISTGVPLQQGLKAIGTLSQWRWLFVAAAIVFALVAILAGGRKLRWTGVTLLLTAGAMAAVWLALQTAGTTPPPGSDTPQLSLAVTKALVSPWIDQVRTAAVVIAVVGAVAIALSLVAGRPKTP